MAAYMMVDDFQRRAFRRERLFCDRMNPLETYDSVGIKKLFRFERENIIEIVNVLTPVIQQATGRNKALLLQASFYLAWYSIFP